MPQYLPISDRRPLSTHIMNLHGYGSGTSAESRCKAILQDLLGERARAQKIYLLRSLTRSDFPLFGRWLRNVPTYQMKLELTLNNQQRYGPIMTLNGSVPDVVYIFECRQMLPNLTQKFYAIAHRPSAAEPQYERFIFTEDGFICQYTTTMRKVKFPSFQSELAIDTTLQTAVSRFIYWANRIHQQGILA